MNKFEVGDTVEVIDTDCCSIGFRRRGIIIRIDSCMDIYFLSDAGYTYWGCPKCLRVIKEAPSSELAIWRKEFPHLKSYIKDVMSIEEITNE